MSTPGGALAEARPEFSAERLCTESGRLAKELAAAPSRWRDYLSMCKPRIVFMAGVAIAVGVYAASRGQWSFWTVALSVLGGCLAAASSFVLNQWWEQDSDRHMERTKDRPLPSGRLSSLEVLCFGSTLGVLGVGIHALCLNAMTAAVTAFTLLSYVFLYTPLKAMSTWNTFVGAIPGALPPVIGWVAVTGSLDAGAWVLFGTLFLWQFPHFFAIAWIYRDDYQSASLKMLPAEEQSGFWTAVIMVATSVVLIPVSMLTTALELTGTVYLWGALILGVAYCLLTVHFLWNRSQNRAKTLFRASLLYLPLLYLLLGFDLKLTGL